MERELHAPTGNLGGHSLGPWEELPEQFFHSGITTMFNLVQDERQVAVVRQQAVFRKVRWLWLAKRNIATERPLPEGADGPERPARPRDFGILLRVFTLCQHRLVRKQVLTLKAPLKCIAGVILDMRTGYPS